MSRCAYSFRLSAPWSHEMLVFQAVLIKRNTMCGNLFPMSMCGLWLAEAFGETFNKDEESLIKTLDTVFTWTCSAISLAVGFSYNLPNELLYRVWHNVTPSLTSTSAATISCSGPGPLYWIKSLLSKFVRSLLPLWLFFLSFCEEVYRLVPSFRLLTFIFFRFQCQSIESLRPDYGAFL